MSMLITKSRPFAFLIALAFASSAMAQQEDRTYDVVVYGGTSAGVMAAVKAARLGKAVVLVAPEKHLGGLTASGLGWTDSGRKEVIGGLSREFYQRIKAHYDQPSAWRQQQAGDYSRYRKDDDAMWVFEPHVAENVYDQYVAEHDVPLHREAYLDRQGGVEKQGTRITAITTTDGQTFRGKMFIDATYEGDLMAAAGVSFTVGREANAAYDETLNGVQTAHAVYHQFESAVDPYVVPGDPSSGLLPLIHPGPPGIDGEADHRVQAYCYRMCLTDAPDNRVPFPKPEGYDPKQYELLARYFATGWRDDFMTFSPAPNRKTDTNNDGAFSTDNIGMSYDYPEATYERRREILAEHEQYQKGLMYFLQHDSRVPDEVRELDEPLGSGAGRIHGQRQLAASDLRSRSPADGERLRSHRARLSPRAALSRPGRHGFLQHGFAQRPAVRRRSGACEERGGRQVSPGGPYLISYRALVPKADECTNLLVPVCLSCSHIAYGSIRMEPVFMILGHSAAVAAALAIDEDTSVQLLDYALLREQLDADGQVLKIPPGSVSAAGLDPKSLPGIVIDDAQATKTGHWIESSSVRGFVGTAYLHDGDEGKGTKSIRFPIHVPKSGRYEVRIAYTTNPNRAPKVPVTIVHKGGQQGTSINETLPPGIAKAHDTPFTSRGTYEFAADEEGAVIISNAGTHGHVVVDAVQLIAEPATP